MKGLVTDSIIVVLIIANVFMGVLNYNVGRPRCLYDGCNRVRVSGEKFCHHHEHMDDGREICLEVTSRK